MAAPCVVGDRGATSTWRACPTSWPRSRPRANPKAGRPVDRDAVLRTRSSTRSTAASAISHRGRRATESPLGHPRAAGAGRPWPDRELVGTAVDLDGDGRAGRARRRPDHDVAVGDVVHLRTEVAGSGCAREVSASGVDVAGDEGSEGVAEAGSHRPGRGWKSRRRPSDALDLAGARREERLVGVRGARRAAASSSAAACRRRRRTRSPGPGSRRGGSRHRRMVCAADPRAPRTRWSRSPRRGRRGCWRRRPRWRGGRGRRPAPGRSRRRRSS